MDWKRAHGCIVRHDVNRDDMRVGIFRQVVFGEAVRARADVNDHLAPVQVFAHRRGLDGLRELLVLLGSSVSKQSIEVNFRHPTSKARSPFRVRVCDDTTVVGCNHNLLAWHRSSCRARVGFRRDSCALVARHLVNRRNVACALVTTWRITTESENIVR